MTSTATLIDTQPWGTMGIAPIRVYNINIGDTATDLTILSTTSATERIFVVGQALAEGGAPTIRYISQSGNLAGTVATTIGSRTITGTSTVFQATTTAASSGFGAGGAPFEIAINTVTVPLITASTSSNTSLTATTSAVSTVSAKTYKRRTTIWAPELAANQPIYDKVVEGYLFCTLPGEALIIRTSAAIGTNNFNLSLIRSDRVPVLR